MKLTTYRRRKNASDENKNRKGNIIATALIIVALLGASAFLLQREVYPTQQSTLHKTMSAFEQNVYSSPDDLLTRYAMQGYQNLSHPLWFCGSYPSTPNLAKTKGDFPSFATPELITKLKTLTNEYPEFNISLSSPQFELAGPQVIQDLSNTETKIIITNFSITIKDGDKLIEKNLSQEEIYNMHFWLMYKGFQSWMKCDSGSIFNNFAKVFWQKSCAFFKDTCICAPGEAPPNGCCDGPTKEQEDCIGKAEDKYQDFAPTERARLELLNGVNEEDIQTAAELLAEDMTLFFNGQTKTFCGKEITMPHTGIECTARIEKPVPINTFFSAYAHHGGSCVFQCPRTCGIVSISEFDSLKCAGNYKCGSDVSCPSCTIELENGRTISGCGGILAGVLANPDKKEIALAGIEAASKITCAKDAKGVWMCGYDMISKDPAYTAMSNCALDIGRSSDGTSGIWKEATNNRDCNPVTPESDGSAQLVGNDKYPQGDTRLKCLQTDGGFETWYGTNGWIDRKGTTDIIVTCSDPGGNGLKPTQAEMRLSVDFRYACNQPSRMRGMAPPACKAPGAGGEGGKCKVPCGTCQSCQQDPTTKTYSCKPAPGSVCPKGLCSTGICSDTGSCEGDNPTDGKSCGNCKVCKGTSCDNADNGISCNPSRTICVTGGKCSDGSCQAEYGGSCNIGCNCQCQADGSYTTSTCGGGGVGPQCKCGQDTAGACIKCPDGSY